MCKRLELPKELLVVTVFTNGTKGKQVWKCRPSGYLILVS